ncbi:MAG: NapC/NirT family cytochrome c [Actinobacteria bacterium]|nr:NapC/NirT family cytochrome c [Actinomycetota bacterium]
MKLNIKLLSVVVIGIAVLSGGTLWATSQSGFCQSCHEMKEDYRAWQASTHKDVSCISCHIGPGAINFIQHKIVAVKEVAYHITGNYEKPINKNATLSESLPSSHCASSSCHDSPGKISNERLIFDHDKHKNTNLNCAYCHNRVAHPGLEDYKDRKSMSLCVDCHQEKNGPTKCDACHPAEFERRPASHIKEDWPKGHDKGDVSACSDCHFYTDRFCTGFMACLCLTRRAGGVLMARIGLC